MSWPFLDSDMHSISSMKDLRKAEALGDLCKELSNQSRQIDLLNVSGNVLDRIQWWALFCHK
jgi:hypothetical protein